MRALTYHGAHDVRVDTVPDPTIQDADDIVLPGDRHSHLRLGPAPLSRQDSHR